MLNVLRSVHRMGWHGAGVRRRGRAPVQARVEPVRPVRARGRAWRACSSTWRRSGRTSRSRSRGARRAWARLRCSTVVVVLALLIGVNYLASRRNKRWDLTANQQFSLSDQTRQILQKLDAPVKVMVFDQPAQFDSFRDRLERVRATSRSRCRWTTSTSTSSRSGQPEPGAVLRHGGLQLQGPHRAGRLGRRAAAHQRADQADHRRSSARCTSSRATARRTSPAASAAATARSLSGLQSDNFSTAPLVLAQAGAVPADAIGGRRLPGRRRTCWRPRWSLLKKYLDGGGKLLVMADPPREG